MESIKITAPASVSNVGCGYDILGYALNIPGDKILIRKTKSPVLSIKSVTGADLPNDVTNNVATIAAQNLLDSLEVQVDHGFEFEIHKMIKPGSGLGSSASSCAAAVFGVNELIGRPYTKEQLLPFAMHGESHASGSVHADNVAPSLLGGFKLIRSYTPLDIVDLKYPNDLYTVILFPDIEIKTSQAREILPKEIPMKTAVSQWANVGGLVSGLAASDFDLIGRSVQDHVAEPVRKQLVQGFEKAKQEALNAGAFGCSLSGSGPSIFALSNSEHTSNKIMNALSKVYKDLGISFQVFISKVNPNGTTIEE